ncbi:hypothetical protein BDV95DRAFT_668072 [Massariosphaeria phaeospora]|uniref:Uncharacterized protein n=1 Tax=Massariosphaeria phaeospora TaxID=100035 RepID=A0A7C8M9L4_9PLEO|nr:hypothetical protein BDV95DRAFT_668072 [Massariosphaeria phaeospora]
MASRRELDPDTAGGGEKVVFISTYPQALAAGNPFLYLPRELRDQIFEDAIIAQFNRFPDMRYVETEKLLSNRPSDWILPMCHVNEMFFAEALPLLIKHTIFVVRKSYTAYNLRYFLEATGSFGQITSLVFMNEEITAAGAEAANLFKDCVNLQYLPVRPSAHLIDPGDYRGEAHEEGLVNILQARNLKCLIFSLSNQIALGTTHNGRRFVPDDNQDWVTTRLSQRGIKMDVIRPLCTNLQYLPIARRGKQPDKWSDRRKDIYDRSLIGALDKITLVAFGKHCKFEQPRPLAQRIQMCTKTPIVLESSNPDMSSSDSHPTPQPDRPPRPPDSLPNTRTCLPLRPRSVPRTTTRAVRPHYPRPSPELQALAASRIRAKLKKHKALRQEVPKLISSMRTATAGEPSRPTTLARRHQAGNEAKTPHIVDRIDALLKKINTREAGDREWFRKNGLLDETLDAVMRSSENTDSDRREAKSEDILVRIYAVLKTTKTREKAERERLRKYRRLDGTVDIDMSSSESMDSEGTLVDGSGGSRDDAGGDARGDSGEGSRAADNRVSRESSTKPLRNSARTLAEELGDEYSSGEDWSNLR